MDVEINLTPTAALIEMTGEHEAGTNGQSQVSERIYARTWGTAAVCTSGALMVHGLGAHSGWFEAMARRLKVNRTFVLAYDQVGFGKGHNQALVSYQQWLDDLAFVFNHQKTLIGDKPLFVMANSMGAAVALKAVIKGMINPNGLVLFSAGLNGHPQTFNLPFRLQALLKAWLTPDQLVALPYTVDLIAKDERIRQWIKTDGEWHSSVPARMLLELLKMTFDLKRYSQRVNCPVLMFNAGYDQIVDTQLNKQIIEKFGSPMRSEITYTKAWHDLMFDPILPELVEELIVWMKAAAKAQGAQAVEPALDTSA